MIKAHSCKNRKGDFERTHIQTNAHIHPLWLAKPMCAAEKSVAHAEKNACNIRFGRMKGGGESERENEEEKETSHCTSVLNALRTL